MANARIYVNEPFDREMILNAIISDVRSWGPQVYQVQSLDITTIAYQLGYDLGNINPFYDVLDVRLTPPPTFNVVDNLDWKRVRFKVLQNQNTTDFPSGNALILTGQGMSGTSEIPIYNYANYTQQLHVVYSTPFTVRGITEQSYLGADIGIDETEFDIPALGAAWRLMSGREARRATTLLQGDPGATEQVPPMYIAKVAEQFKIIRDSRLGDAEARLMRKYPWRMTH